MKLAILSVLAAIVFSQASVQAQAQTQIPALTFEDIDTNGDGFIDKEEGKVFAFNLHGEMTQEQFQNGYNDLDADQDGKISPQQFEAVDQQAEYQGQIQYRPTLTFQDVDTNGDGFIDRQEGKAYAEYMYQGISQEQFDDGFKFLDADQDGQISPQQFDAMAPVDQPPMIPTFADADTNADGIIDMQEAKTLADVLMPGMSQEQFKRGLAYIDTDGNQEITEEQFNKAFQMPSVDPQTEGTVDVDATANVQVQARHKKHRHHKH